MKVKITVEIDVPEGATHYGGDLTDDPIYYKCKLIAGHPHWFVFKPSKQDWYLSSHREPHWCKPLSERITGEPL